MLSLSAPADLLSLLPPALLPFTFGLSLGLSPLSLSLPPSLPPSLIYAGMTCRSVAASEEASGMTLVVLVVGG